jgi:multicopper oxidase
MGKFAQRSDARYDASKRTWHYEVVALSVPIVFNPHRDHDPDGMLYALATHRAELERLGARWNALLEGQRTVAELAELTAHPLVRPLVLRARAGDTIVVKFTNHLRRRCAGMHLVAPGTDVDGDGSHVGSNPSSLACPGETVEYTWRCPHEGAFVIHDIGDPDGDETGSNAHGLFGALIVEPRNAWWTDPTQQGLVPVADGLYVDVHQRPEDVLTDPRLPRAPFPGESTGRPPRHAHPEASFREYVLLFHDEPEWRERRGSDELIAANPCPLRHHDAPDECPKAQPGEPFPLDHGGEQGSDAGGGGHGGHELPSLMLFNYRSEPMKNRERLIWRWLYEKKLKDTVINEEQHHSSWMFGDPATPVLKGYVGDPARIRLLHAGVKETHVFHLHMYEWYRDPGNPRSPIIDAISITPQTGHTIVPLYGTGNIQAVPGDIIWHCHLYPHFHMGMWGMWRGFDTLQTGETGPELTGGGVYRGRRIGHYPDGTPIERLAVLPDREAPPAPSVQRPGFPLFIAGELQQKSPKPPWPGALPIPDHLDYRPAQPLELAAMNSDPKPGEMFTRIPHPTQRTWWVDTNGDGVMDALRQAPASAQVNHCLAAAHGRIDYNEHAEWHDPDGHFFFLADERDPFDPPKPEEPLFFRARAGDVLNLTFTNAIGFRTPRGPVHVHSESQEHIPRPTQGQLEWMHYDFNIPPCDCLLVDGEERPGAECGLHVHIVKFDPIAADGASVGWNYLSAPEDGKKLVYRWWCDEEFGTIFFHDHLFANTRQRHGLFGALIVEPARSRFLDPWERDKEILTGSQAVIELPSGERFREFCLGLADWVAMYRPAPEPDVVEPLEPPETPSGHDDNGTMAVNYRCEPLRERGDDPHRWFSSAVREPETPIFHTRPGEPIRIRLIQGSHEEQHSFQVHGLRWRAFRRDVRSPQRNQQTLGISEAFTFDIDHDYGAGDYLWRLAGTDDTWLGCWGLIRAHAPGSKEKLPWPIHANPASYCELPPPPEQRRRFRVKAVQREIVYREGDAQRTRLADPRGLAFVATAMASPGQRHHEPLGVPQHPLEPLVLRCRTGEWVEIELENELPGTLAPERHPPELPVASEPPYRVSNRVSLHTDLLRYDVETSDGAWVGQNPDQTVGPGEKKTYLLHANVEPGAVLLQDMADVRNHRHHGLFGALVVEPQGVTPLRVGPGQPSAGGHVTPHGERAWTGARATLFNRVTDECVEEMVLLLHDGVRYYVDGIENDGPTPNPPDIPEGAHGEEEAGGEPAGDHGAAGHARAPDPEDQGHKAFNYRSERLDGAFVEDVPLANPRFHFPTPATPIVHVPRDADVVLRLVCAADKPRNHGFTLHGHAWREWPHRGAESPVMSSEGALSSGTVRSYRFRANHQPGDYLYRSSVFKWVVAQGAWGILRVH